MIDFNLYLITDRHQTKGRPLAEVVEEALMAGAEAIRSSGFGVRSNPIAVQLREKDLSAKELFELALSIKQLTDQYGAKLFINDRLDVALAAGADGVHLGQKSFSPKDVKKFLSNYSSRFFIGVSTHSLAEAKKAEDDGADFITLGPVSHTPSKAEYGEPLGIEAIKKIKQKIKIPVFAIGGIKKENAKDVMNAGAAGIAVISAVMGAGDAGKAVREIWKETT